MRPGLVRGRDGRNYGRSAYLSRHGTRFGRHWGYRGSWHRHWSRRWFSSRWNAWTYFDPCTSGWYYWCGQRDMYLPCSYMTTCAPDTSECTACGGGGDDIPPADDDEAPNDLPDAPGQ